MSLLMLILFGIAPLSGVFAGWLIRVASVDLVFAGAGALLMAIVIVAWLGSPMRAISDIGDQRSEV